MKKKGGGKIHTPVKELNEGDTIVHYNAVLIEDLNSKMQLVLECVQVMAERMDKLESRMEKLESRMEKLENRMEKLENRMDGLEGRVSTVEFAVRGLKDDTLDMERRICSKINRITERCQNHERRFDALEAS